LIFLVEHETNGLVEFQGHNLVRKIKENSSGRYVGIWGNKPMRKNTGVHQFFVRIVNSSLISYIFVGIMEAKTPYFKSTVCLGFSPRGFGYSHGYKWYNNMNILYGSFFTRGDIVGVRFDSDALTLHFSTNAQQYGLAFDQTFLTGEVYWPYFNLDKAGDSISILPPAQLTFSDPFFKT